MIGRSVFHRAFYRLLDKKLSLVLDEANDSLISEIGEIDNYLTGIILRFLDDHVEYVNAGHTDIFLKRASSGKIQSVGTADVSFKGFFLGFRQMQYKSKMIRFSMLRDDILLLYTDCLLESTRNGDRNSLFGEEGIIRALGKAPAGSAKGALDYILDEFYSFTGGKNLEDDLTVIAIRKK